MFTTPTVLEQLHAAVDNCRKGRHHADCSCGMFRHGDGQFCSAEEWRWHRMIDRLLDIVCRVEANPVATAIEDRKRVS